MKFATVLCACFVFYFLKEVDAMGKYRGLEFLEPCSKRDPHLEACLAHSANVLADHFRHGKCDDTSRYWKLILRLKNLSIERKQT